MNPSSYWDAERKQYREYVRSELKVIKNELKEIKQLCSRMDNHINFVESSYSIVRNPINWLISRLNPTSEQLESIDMNMDTPRITGSDADKH